MRRREQVAQTMGARQNTVETERPVRTASSEQVRRPIYKEATEEWRTYEPFLGPLKDALGEVLECYPEPPEAFVQR